MSLLTLILTIVIIGVIMWAINAFIPMTPAIKKLLNVVVVIFIVVWLIMQFLPNADLNL